MSGGGATRRRELRPGCLHHRRNGVKHGCAIRRRGVSAGGGIEGALSKGQSSEKRNAYVDSLRGWIRAFRRCDGHSGQVRHPDTVATAIRTLVVLAFAWTMVFVVGSQGEIRNIGPTTLFFLVLSGLATGASWLCYFKALQLGDINKVVPIDKSSTVLTILLAFFLLGEPIGLPQGIGVVLIGTGTFLMLEKRSPAAGCAPQCGSWMLYAFGSAVFASLTAILGKAGIQGVESNLGTAIRTGVVLVMAWLMVLVTGKAGAVRQVPRRELAFICLSGVATGASWLCYYRALQSGPASVVVPIDKLSILVTVAFSRLVFQERLTSRSAAGLALIVAGTLAMLF